MSIHERILDAVEKFGRKSEEYIGVHCYLYYKGSKYIFVILWMIHGINFISLKSPFSIAFGSLVCFIFTIGFLVDYYVFPSGERLYKDAQRRILCNIGNPHRPIVGEVVEAQCRASVFILFFGWILLPPEIVKWLTPVSYLAFSSW